MPTVPTRDGAVVALRNVSKAYTLYSSTQDMVLDRLGAPRFLMRKGGRDIRDFYALRNVNLEIGKGERVGIIGRNGAGKSTLLKLVTGNFKPTSGDIEVNGTVQALMQSGLGFNADATGLENIRSSLEYSGLIGAEFEAAVDDVVDFVELGDFLHQPISVYSQGMLARLQFATATAIKPDILIVDEVMGAGDAYFSAKCSHRMRGLTKFGCTLLLVSHSPQQVIQFCSRAIWLHHGEIVREGDATSVVAAYEVYIERLNALGIPDVAAGGDVAIDQTVSTSSMLSTLSDGRQVHRWLGRPELQFDSFSVTSRGFPVDAVTAGDDLEIEFNVKANSTGHFRCIYYITLWTKDGRRAARLESPRDEFQASAGERRSVRVALSPLRLGGGSYVLSFSMYRVGKVEEALERYDVLMRCYSLRVTDPRQGYRAAAYPASNWKFTEATQR